MDAVFPSEDSRRLLRLALQEDVRTGDVTCRFVLPDSHTSTARVVAREAGVFAGTPLLPLALAELDGLDPDSRAGSVRCTHLVADGASFQVGQTLLTMEGSTRAILEVERVLLNLLQHLCGVATSARTYQEAAGPGCRILDTRKTTPGQRTLEKWAIVQGGGSNHRMGLWDTVLIKENHAAACGGVRAACEKALSRRPPGMAVITEVRDLEELRGVLDLPLERILLDNFSPDQVRQARTLRDESGAVFGLEASGGITLSTLSEYARAGAEFVSVGALTHTVRPIDLSLLLEGT